MPVVFTCLVCNRKLEVGDKVIEEGKRVRLECQGCGGIDLQTDTSIILSPVYIADICGPTIELKKDKEFSSEHKKGRVWIIQKIDEPIKEIDKEEEKKQKPKLMLRNKLNKF
jgi:transcription elongation factor Elf1